MEAMVFVIPQIFFAARPVLKISNNHSDMQEYFPLGTVQSCDAFKPIAQERKYK